MKKNSKPFFEIWRFKVELSDGTVIPIPEKKYTSVKKKLIGNGTVISSIRTAMD